MSIEFVIEFVIIKDSWGERISANLIDYQSQCPYDHYLNGQNGEKKLFYINNRTHKRYYEKIRKMIGSYNKTLALLNIKNDDPMIVIIANLILHQVPYSIKYIDMTKAPFEIKYRHYDGVNKSFT